MRGRIRAQSADGIVIGAIHAHDRGAFAGNRVHARLRGVGGHVDAGVAAGIAGGAGDGAAMIPLAGAHDRVPGRQGALGGEGLHGEPVPELEGVQAKSAGLVLDHDAAHAEPSGQAGQVEQRGGREVWARREEGTDLLVLVGREQAAIARGD